MHCPSRRLQQVGIGTCQSEHIGIGDILSDRVLSRSVGPQGTGAGANGQSHSPVVEDRSRSEGLAVTAMVAARDTVAGQVLSSPSVPAFGGRIDGTVLKRTAPVFFSSTKAAGWDLSGEAGSWMVSPAGRPDCGHVFPTLFQAARWWCKTLHRRALQEGWIAEFERICDTADEPLFAHIHQWLFGVPIPAVPACVQHVLNGLAALERPPVRYGRPEAEVIMFAWVTGEHASFWQRIVRTCHFTEQRRLDALPAATKPGQMRRL